MHELITITGRMLTSLQFKRLPLFASNILKLQRNLTDPSTEMAGGKISKTPSYLLNIHEVFKDTRDVN